MKKLHSMILILLAISNLMLFTVDVSASDVFEDNEDFIDYGYCQETRDKTTCIDEFVSGMKSVQNEEEVDFLLELCGTFAKGRGLEKCRIKVSRMFTDYMIENNGSICNANQERNDGVFIDIYRYASSGNIYSEKAEKDCIVDVKTARHYCGLMETKEGTCLKENALRLNNPLICKNEVCVAQVAIKNKDPLMCEQTENVINCYASFASKGSKEGLDYPILYQACEKLIEMNNDFTPPSSGSYSDPGRSAINCILNITENKDDTTVCDNFDDKLKERCIWELTSTSLEEKRTEASKSFAENVKSRESGFYYSYLIYALFALLLIFLYWKFKNLRPVVIFNLIILTLIIIFGSSIKLEAYISWQRLSAAVAGSGWSFGDPTRILVVDHSHFHGVWPWWMIVVYFNLSDLIFAFIPSVIVGILGHKKAALAINISLFLFMTGFYILAQIGQGLAG